MVRAAFIFYRSDTSWWPFAQTLGLHLWAWTSGRPQTLYGVSEQWYGRIQAAPVHAHAFLWLLTAPHHVMPLIFAVLCPQDASWSSSIYNTLVTVLQNSRWHWSLWRTNVFQDRGTPHYLLLSEHICVQDDMGWHLRCVTDLWILKVLIISAR